MTPLRYQVALTRHSETYGVLVPPAIFAIVIALWPLRRVREPGAGV